MPIFFQMEQINNMQFVYYRINPKEIIHHFQQVMAHVLSLLYTLT